MSRIIFVNRYYYPDHSATSQLLTDLTFALAQEGLDVHVVTSRQRYDDPEARLSAEQKTEGVSIHRVWTTRFGRASIIGRAVDYATFYVSAALRLLALTRSNDLLVSKTDPPLISVIAMLVSIIRGAILVNWIQDLFPEVAEALDIKPIRIGAAPLRWLRNLSLRVAKDNVVLGERMAARLRDSGIDENAVTIIHNWSDAVSIYPVARYNNKLRDDWELRDKFVVGYSGNMGRAHEFKTLLGAAQRLRDESNIVFLFIGGGAQRNVLESEVFRLGLTNVIFKPYQPRESLAVSLSVPDLHVISLLPQMEGLIVPSKFYGIAAAGRPTLFIGDVDGEIPRILDTYHCGKSVRMGDADSAVRYIQTLSDGLDDLLEWQGCNARMAFEKVYSKSFAINKWKQLLCRSQASVYA